MTGLDATSAVASKQQQQRMQASVFQCCSALCTPRPLVHKHSIASSWRCDQPAATLLWLLLDSGFQQTCARLQSVLHVCNLPLNRSAASFHTRAAASSVAKVPKLITCKMINNQQEYNVCFCSQQHDRLTAALQQGPAAANVLPAVA